MTKLYAAQERLLLEAFRRYVSFHQGEELTRAWTGLGTYTYYKPALKAGLMDYATSPNPGYITWFKLTEKGAQIVQEWLDEKQEV